MVAHNSKLSFLEGSVLGQEDQVRNEKTRVERVLYGEKDPAIVIIIAMQQDLLLIAIFLIWRKWSLARNVCVCLKSGHVKCSCICWDGWCRFLVHCMFFCCEVYVDVWNVYVVSGVDEGGSLTATVEPFLPIPPARMTRMICQKDQPPQNNVIMDMDDHTCRSPYTYKLICVWFL